MSSRNSRSYGSHFSFMSWVLIIAFISFVGWGIARTVKAVQFRFNCEQYIKRAADASSIEIAKGELEKVLSYCEDNGLTEGVVSIFFKQPKNDIGFWYQNLKMAYEELENLPEDTTTLEKTNLLMKVRETLVDTDSNGTKITLPDGISIYPYNLFYFFWTTISLIVFIFSGVYLDKR